MATNRTGSPGQKGRLTKPTPPHPFPAAKAVLTVQWIRGGMVGESRRFSPGDKQQEATHLHFQRPAPSAFLPPGRARGVRVCPGALRPRRPWGRPAEPSQAPTPTSASRGPGWRAWPGQPDPGVGGFREGLALRVGTKGDPALGLGSPRASGSQTWAPRPGCAAWGRDLASREVSAASGGAERGRSPTSPVAVCYWLPRGREKGKAPAAGPWSEASCPRPPPGAWGPSQLRRSRWTSRPPGQGRPRRRRPGARAAASPPPGPAASLPPPPARRTAAATARAAGGARNGAGLAASPRAGERGEPRRATPPGPRPPETASATSPWPGARCPRGFLGARLGGGTAACSGRPTPTGEEGRKRRGAAISCPAPAPACGSALKP